MTTGWPISQEALFNKETNFYYIHCTRHLKAAFRLNEKKKSSVLSDNLLKTTL